MRVCRWGVFSLARVDPQQVDVPDVALSYSFFQRLGAGGPPVIIGVPSRHDGADRVRVAAFFHAVDDFVVAPVATDGHDKNVVCAAGGLAGQFNGVPGVAGRLKLQIHRIGEECGQPVPEFFGELGRITGAVGVEDDDYFFESPGRFHGVLLVHKWRQPEGWSPWAEAADGILAFTRCRRRGPLRVWEGTG